MVKNQENQSSVLKTELLRSKIYEGICSYQDPYLSVNLGAAGCIKDIIINSRQIVLNLQFGFNLNDHLNYLHKQLNNILDPIVNELAEEVGINLILKINIENKILTHAYNRELQRIPNIKNIIAIGSGKGGVGKSTVAVNLATALKEQGAAVGILDADLYGPSLPHMLGCVGKANVVGSKLQPHFVCGLYCISIGNLLDQEDTPLVWRGPMVSGGLLQLLHDTIWPDLDYLIVDLPPGTGDIQLTLAQKIPVSGAVIITTPQPVAVLDAQKALVMFNKLNIPILGVIENMSYLVCTNCDYKQEIFGSSGGIDMANRYNIRMLGSIPLDLGVRRQSDLGVPAVLAFSGSEISNTYHKIATNIAAELSILPVDLKIGNHQIILE